MKGRTPSTEESFEGLGEGRSKAIYIEPNCTDTAVLMAFYNPVPFKRNLKNIRYLIHIFKTYKIPFFVAECVFGERKQQIPEATLVVRSNTYLFYKEQLLNALEPLVPAKYTKLVLLDGDILFDSPDWLDQTSIALEKHDIIQPFSQACWLNPLNTIIAYKKYSYAVALSKKWEIEAKTIFNYHPGFAWAVRRDFFKKMGGLYDRAIVGGGDMSLVCTFLSPSCIESYKKNNGVPSMIFETWYAYQETMKRLTPRLGFLDIKALHLFHGLSKQRQYTTRYKLLTSTLENAVWEDSIVLNKDGLYEFKDPKLRDSLYSYFAERDEDISLKDIPNLRTHMETKQIQGTVPNSVVRELFDGRAISRGTRKLRRRGVLLNTIPSKTFKVTDSSSNHKFSIYVPPPTNLGDAAPSENTMP